MKITLTITDTPEGGVRVDCSHKTEDLLDVVRGKPTSATSACMYALGMMTWATRRSREMGRNQNLIILPPGTRNDPD